MESAGDHGGWDIDRLMDELQAIYVKTNRSEAWEDEEASIRDFLTRLPERMHRYTDPRAIGVGGLGIVLKIHDQLLNEQPCAVKFPRPKPGSHDLFATMISKEIGYLARIRHAGIVRIHGAGNVSPSDNPNTPTPFYIMDFVEGSDSLSYLADTQCSTIVETIALTADAIAALHEADLVHCDLKPDNIMIDGREHPVLTDLGTTKAFRPEDDSSTRIGVTRSFAPRELAEFIAVASETDPDNFSGEIKRSQIKKRWDLVCLGKTILTWLGYTIETGEAQQLTYSIDPYIRKYLLLMCARLLGPKDSYGWLDAETKLPTRVIGEVTYQSISEVVVDIDKLSGRYDLAKRVPELDPYSPHIIQVGAGVPTVLTSRVRALIDHPSLRRLGSITQLGIVNQVYMTATHTRLEHSLGTYAHVCRMIRSLYNDPYSPLFRQLMSDTDLSAILALSLLHDSGQFPLAHDLEEIEPQLFDHKRLTEAVVNGGRDPKVRGYKSLELPPMEKELEQWGLVPEQLVHLLNVGLDHFQAGVKERLLHSLIDGAIDADKLDYLDRDSKRLEVPYGRAIDQERIANGVTAIVSTYPHGNLVACVGVHEKAREAAEHLGIARSAMFSRVYWHHTVRAMKAMLTRPIQRIAVHLEDSTEERNRFMSGFERFVMSLPSSLSPRGAQLEFSGADGDDDGAGAVPLVSADDTGMLAATDAAVLMYLEEYMRRSELRDSDLLRAIRHRTLYKRLHVWSLSGEDDHGGSLVANWKKLDARQKLGVHETLEQDLAELIGSARDRQPETIALSQESIDRVQNRIEGRLPVLLIDLPGEKSAAKLPLYYVRETERRALRKDGSAVGDANSSETWKEYGIQLQAKAGKLRIFCHGDLVNSVEAAMPRDEFAKCFEAACRQVVG